MSELRNFIIKAHEGDEIAFDEFFVRMEHRIRHDYDVINNAYGWRELTKSIPPGKADEKIREIVKDIVLNFDPKKSDRDEMISTYVNKWATGHVKKWICEINGFSSYYVDWLVRIKNAGLDLWETPAEELAVFAEGCRKGPADGMKLIAKLRHYFPNPEHPEREYPEVYSVGKSVAEVSIALDIRPTYAKYLLCIDAAGLNLWEDSEQLTALVGSTRRRPERTIARLRAAIREEDAMAVLAKIHEHVLPNFAIPYSEERICKRTRTAPAKPAAALS